MRFDITAWGQAGSRFLAALVAGLVLSVGAHAAPVVYDILLDTDNDPGTGCSMATPGGDFSGVELVLSTTVDVTPSAATVTGVTLRRCEGATLGAANSVSGGTWPVGSIELARADPVAIIETFLPLAELDQATSVRAAVTAHTPDGGDALLGAQLLIQRGAPGSVMAVPTLSPLMLALLAAGLGLGGAWLARRHRASFMVLGLCLLVGASGVAWAATIILDGEPNDWADTQRRLSGDEHSTNLVRLWFTHDTQNAYFRIDACGRGDQPRGTMRKEGDVRTYVTREGNWEVRLDHHTVTMTRLTLCHKSSVQVWGIASADPVPEDGQGTAHENLNGKHIKDFKGYTRTMLLDDGTKLTFHVDPVHRGIMKTSLYDGDNSFEFDNVNNDVTFSSADPVVGQQRDEAEADGETAHVEFVRDTSEPGSFGYLRYANIYTQDAAGPAPQCLSAPLDPLCTQPPLPLGETGDIYLQPNRVDDYYDDARLPTT